MEFVPAFNTCEAELRFTLNGEKVENTLYFQRAEGWPITVMTSLGTALTTWWSTAFASAVTSQMSLREVYVTDLTTQDGPAFPVIPASPVVGAQGGNPFPNNVALCVSFRTSNRGRSARGRNYYAGFVEGQIVSQQVTTSMVNGIVDAYMDLIPLAESLDATWVVCSRVHNKVPRTTATLYLIRAATVVDRTVDSQRRRLPGRGQ